MCMILKSVAHNFPEFCT